MKRGLTNKILKPGGSVMTTRQILSYIKQFKGTPLSIKLKKALVQMRKLKIGSAKIEIDPKLLNHAFMPESTSYEEMVGLYGVEEHDAPLDGTAKKGTFFAEVSRRILKKIKEGVLPWQAGWKSTKDTRKGEPVMFANYITNKNYRGVNFVMCMMFGGGDRYFLTKNQITERGGKLTPGATGVPICYFIKTKKTHTVEVVGEKGEKEVVEYNEYLKGMLYYIAYPLSQTEGVKEITRQTVKVEPEKEFKPLAIAEKIVSSYPPKAPPISHHGDKAFYTPTYDTVTMPMKKAFKNEANYYSVLFHELIHSTGHPKRLNRLVPASFGSKKYAAEELVAELGASFLTAICGIDYHTLNNSAAYLAGWAQKLTNEINQDKTFFVRTQFAAIKAAKYMMGAFYKEWEKEPKKKPISKKKQQPSPEPKPKASNKVAIQTKLDLRGIDAEEVVLKVKALSTKQAKKLGLGNGNVVLKAGNEFFGVKHILIDHKDLFKNPAQVIEFVRENLKKFDEIRRAKTGNHKRFALVEIIGKKVSIVELELGSNSLRVVTAYKMAKTQIENMPLIWIRPEQLGSQPSSGGLPGYSALPNVNRGVGHAFGTSKLSGTTNLQKPRQKDTQFEEILQIAKECFPNAEVKEIKPPTTNSGIGPITTAENLSGIVHESLKLQGIWKDWIGEPATNFDMMLSGSPGSGKSTLLLQFANYLANDLKKRVLFVSKEEYGSATLSEKIDRLKIKGVHFTNTITPDARIGNDYDIVFIDSITNLRFVVQDYQKLKEINPEIAFVLVLQQTKANKFKGNNEWPHEVEIVTEVDSGEAIATKNRYCSFSRSIKIPNYI